MRIALPFGLLQLAGTIVQVYLMVVGVETVRPLPMFQLLLNTGGALGVIWLGLQFRRQPR